MTVVPLKSFQDIWALVRDRSLLVRLLGVRALGQYKFTGHNGPLWGRALIPLLICAFYGFAPILLNLAFALIDLVLLRQTTSDLLIRQGDYPLALVLALLTTAMLFAAFVGLRFADDRQGELDLTLKDPDLNAQIVWTVRFFSSWITQTIVPVALIGVLAYGMLSWATNSGHAFSVIGWIAALWPVLFGAWCLLWCLPLPFILDVLLRPNSKPRMVTHNPSSTPWVRILSRLVGLGGGLIAAIALLVSFTYLTLVLADKPSDPNSLLYFARTILPVLVIILVSTAVLFWGIPAWQLTTLVTHSKRLRLAELDRRIRALKKTPDDPKRHELIEEYRFLSSSPDTPFASGSVVQYVAALAGAVLGVFLLPILRALGFIDDGG